MEYREKVSGEMSNKSGQEERDPFKQALRGHPEVMPRAEGITGGARRPNEALDFSCVDGAPS